MSDGRYINWGSKSNSRYLRTLCLADSVSCLYTQLITSAWTLAYQYIVLIYVPKMTRTIALESAISNLQLGVAQSLCSSRDQTPTQATGPPSYDLVNTSLPQHFGHSPILHKIDWILGRMPKCQPSMVVSRSWLGTKRSPPRR